MSPLSWESYITDQEAAADGAAMADMVKAVLDANGAESFADLNRNLYKYTDCGASLGLECWWGEMVWNGNPRMAVLKPGDIKGIGVGSIVEGVDETVEHRFIYPQSFLDGEDEDVNAAFRKAYSDLVESVERDARDIWNRTHGCEACGDEDEFGDRAINPECAECGGEGTIF